MRYRTVTVDVDVEVDLSDFDDDVIREEYEERFGDGGGGDPSNTDEALPRIYHAMRQGKTELAHELMWDYVRDKLGVAV